MYSAKLEYAGKTENASKCATTQRDRYTDRLRRGFVIGLHRKLQRSALTRWREPLVINDALDRHDPFDQRLGARGTSRNVHINRHELIDTLDRGVRVEHPAGAGTGAHADHPLGFGHLLINV